MSMDLLHTLLQYTSNKIKNKGEEKHDFSTSVIIGSRICDAHQRC